MRKSLTIIILALLALAPVHCAFATESQPALPVWPDLSIPASQRTGPSSVSPAGNLRFLSPVRWPTLQPFLPATNANGCAMVICPGGAYVEESITKEGYRVAEWFSHEGVSCFVLKYRLPDGHLPPGGVPWPLQDVRRAVQMIRARAAEWHIDPHRVGVMGFSAGGSVASLAGVHWLPGNPQAEEPLDHFSTRPDFLVLGYPVISMMPGITHSLSHARLLGRDASRDLDRYFSSELNVTPLTPAAFIFYAHDDTTVNHRNEEQFYRALKLNGVAVRLMEFKHGRHGFGLGVPGTDSTRWPSACIQWLKQQGFLDTRTAQR